MEKYNQLKKYLLELGNVTVAFSGGVDSTLLLFAAKEVLGERAHAVIVKSEFVPERESKEAIEFVKEYGIDHKVLQIEVLKDEEISANPANRCYLCKKRIFTEIVKAAREQSSTCVAEGSNMDDGNDYRPGMKAIEELGIKSPLKAVDLYKSEIREILQANGIEVWKKPSFSCLATRLPFGEDITGEKLRRISAAEQYLMDAGFRQIRVRDHNGMARIEIEQTELEKILDRAFMNKIHGELENMGFQYVTLDLAGYRTGSMNQSLV